MKHRNEAIDILKGIGIILVLVAHALGGCISHIAYTFHMPLFFIVTGLFITAIDGNGFLTNYKIACLKDFKRLIVPAVFTLSVIVLISLLSYVVKKSYLKNPIELLWNSNPDKPFNNINILGNLWFLFALFFAKQAFYLLRKIADDKWIGYLSVVLGSLAVIAGKYISIPFEILVGISVLPFIWIGYYCQCHNYLDSKFPKWLNLSIVIWAAYIFIGGLRVDLIEYTLGYIPDIIAACGGTLFFYYVSKLITSKTRYLHKILSFLGVYSLILICAPTIETYCFPMQEIIPALPMRSVLVLLGKVGWCALSLYICIKAPFLRKVFGVK